MSKSSRAKHNLNLKQLRGYRDAAQKLGLHWSEGKRLHEERMDLYRDFMKFLSMRIREQIDSPGWVRSIFRVKEVDPDVKY